MNEIKLPEFDRVLKLDFETHFDSKKKYNLRALTTSTYVTDPRFETIGCGIVSGSKRRWMNSHTLEAYFSTIDWSRTACLAHHSHFDGFILSHRYGVKPIFWFDTMSMANALFTNEGEGSSIAFLAEHYGLGQKGNDAKAGSWADGKRYADFTQEEFNKYGEYCLNDCYIMGAAFEKMLPHFSNTELILIDQTIKAFTDPKIHIDRPLLESEIKKEEAKKEALLERVGLTRKEVGKNELIAQAFRELGVEPPKKMSPTTKKEIYAFSKSDPGMLSLLEHENEEVRWLAAARLGVKSTIAESRYGRILKISENNQKAPIYLKYSAASTHRWGGGDKTNFQNLPRGTKKAPSPLRMAILSPSGHKILAMDSAQIEARGLAWLAGERQLVDAFVNKRDLYSEFASQVYGRHVDRKNVESDAEAGNMGKTSILGLGYGMGWAKFATTLLAGPMGAPPIRFTLQDAERMDISVDGFKEEHEKRLRKIVSRLSYEDLAAHCSVAHKTVNLYRNTYTHIRAFWREMDEAIGMMANGQEGAFGPEGQFKIEPGAILLPSGHRLRYSQLKWFREPSDLEDEKEFKGYKYYGGRGKGFTKIYGGLLTENICQAFCRDVIGEQIARSVCNYGYPVITTTHDEGVFLVKENEAEQAFENILKEFRIPPVWCAGVPLNAEGGFHERYGKAK